MLMYDIADKTNNNSAYTQLFAIFASRIMSDTITIRKGLDLPIGGAAEQHLTDARSISTYAVKPTDFVGLTPRFLVE